MVDNKTPHLSLPLPHESNLLTEDVLRLREAFASLDTHAAQLETELAESLAAALTAATDAAKTALWAGITGKPDAFPPSTHSHSFAELGDAPAAFPPAVHGHDWAEVAGKPSTFTPATHAHGWTEVTAKPTTFTPASHSHAVGEISGTLPTSKGGTGNTSGNISGNAGTATRWQSSRNLSLYGDATGSVNWDGSGNVSLPVTLAASAKGPMMPTAETFVALIGGSSTPFATRLILPAGGTWAYCLIPAAACKGNNGGQVISYDVMKENSYTYNTTTPSGVKLIGVAAGGTLVGYTDPFYGFSGFAWRIA